MRFVVAVILVIVYGIISVANSQGMPSLSTLIGYTLGSVIIGPALIAALFCIPKSGRNNKRFFRAFNVVLLLSILAGIGRFESVYGAPPKTITDNMRMTQITVPGSWKSDQITSDKMLFKLKDRSGNMTIIVGYEEIGDDAVALEKYSELIGNQLKENPSFISRSEIRPCEHAQYTCFYQVVTMAFDKTNTESIVASLEGKGKYYNYVATTSSRLYERNKDELFKALNSFQEIGE